MASNCSLIEEWASRVVSFSSQYDSSGWSANKILGMPRVYPNYGDLQGAWAQGNCSANEFIEIEFPKKLYVKELEIYETLNAGAVTKILLKTPNGQWKTVFETNSPAHIQHSRIFKPPLEETEFESNQVRIEMNCTIAHSWCELDAVKMKGRTNNLASPPPLKSLADDLSSLVNSKDFSDITIKVEDEMFYAHKAILSVRCDYFKAMFSSGMRESLGRQVLEIPDISKNAFMGVLQYLYTHEIDKNIVPISLVELIRVADRFSLDGLQKLCAVYLNGRIDTDNVVSIYREATEKLPVLEDIKRECVRFITRNMQAVSRTDEFTRLPQQVMLDIVQASAAQLSLG